MKRKIEKEEDTIKKKKKRKIKKEEEKNKEKMKRKIEKEQTKKMRNMEEERNEQVKEKSLSKWIKKKNGRKIEKSFPLLTEVYVIEPTVNNQSMPEIRDPPNLKQGFLKMIFMMKK